MDDFGSFYAARKDVVLRAVAVMTGNRTTAEDAVAEAFTRACERWDKVRRHANPTAWVLRTAINTQRSWWRRLIREVPGDPADWAAPEAGPPGMPSDLRHLVAQLPRRQREVVALRVIADLSAEDAARMLDISPATVHVHLHRALSTLRAGLTGAAQPQLQQGKEPR
jgi:DNA-directed RNA polymerase specialized sigma24 family protein